MPGGDSPLDRLRRAADPHRAAGIGAAARAAQRYVDDGMPERAPALAYYAVLSLFPALVVMIAAIRFVGGDHAPEDISAYAQHHGASGPLTDALRTTLRTVAKAPAPSAGAAGALGAVTSIYGASRAFTATGRAVDVIGGQRRRPRSLVRRAEDIGWTLVLIVVALVAVVLIAVSGNVLRDALGVVGLSGAAVTVWSVLRWPAVALLMIAIVALVRWAAPTGGRPPFRLSSPGTLFTVGALLAGGAGFDLYVSVVADYDATYGTFAGAVILMVFVWLAGAALLYGAELDAVLDERRAATRLHASSAWDDAAAPGRS